MGEHTTWRRWIGPGLGALTACVLFALRSRELTGDSIDELRAIGSGRDLFHPHHLLFRPIVRGVYLALAAVSPSCDAVFAAQAHNTLWAGLSVAAAYWILSHELGSRLAAAPWALGVAASAGFVTFATQVEAYIPATGCLLLLGALLLHARRGPARTLAAALLYAAAVTYHQSAIFFALPLLFLLRRGEPSRTSSASWALPYVCILLVSGTLVLGAYVLASGQRSIAGVLLFASSYLRHPNPDWGTVANLSPTGLGQLLRSQLVNFVRPPSVYSSAANALAVAFGLGLGTLAAVAVAEVRRRREFLTQLLFPISWLLVNWSFFLWFFPGESDHFLQNVFPLSLLGGLVLHGGLRSPRLRRAGAVTGLALLLGGASWNMLTLVIPKHRDPGPIYHEAAALARLGLLERSLVLGDFELGLHLTYFFGAPATENLLLRIRGFYQGGMGTDLAAADDAERVVVPVRYVLPAYRLGPYSGWSHPRGWLAFLRWLSAFEPAGRDGPATHAALELVHTDSGQGYLVCDRHRRVAGDLRALLAALDELLAGSEAAFVQAGGEELRRAERD